MAYEFIPPKAPRGPLGLDTNPGKADWSWLGNGAPPPGYSQPASPTVAGMQVRPTKPISTVSTTKPLGPDVSPGLELAWLPPDSPLRKAMAPKPKATPSGPAFNFGNRLDQAVMSPGGAPATITDSVLPPPSFKPKPPPLRNPKDIGDYALKNGYKPPVPTDPNGYALVDGRRINYQDIGAKKDPLSRSGGYVMTSPGNNGAFVPPESNVGIANQDAADRRAMLDASGVGVNGTQPLSLAQRMNQQSASGWGALIDAQLAGKFTKDDSRRFENNRTFAINSQETAIKGLNAQSDADYKRGLLENSRNESARKDKFAPIEAEKGRADIAKLRSETDKNRWEMSPEGLAAKGAAGAKGESLKQMRDHLVAQGADPGHPENIQRYNQYLSDRQRWNDAAGKVFLSMGQNGNAYIPLFREYVNATPEQKAALDQRQDVQVMKQVVSEIGRRKGYGDLIATRPAAPVYQYKNMKDTMGMEEAG